MMVNLENPVLQFGLDHREMPCSIDANYLTNSGWRENTGHASSAEKLQLRGVPLSVGNSFSDAVAVKIAHEMS